MKIFYSTFLTVFLLSSSMDGQENSMQLLMPIGTIEVLPVDFDQNGQLDFVSYNGIVELNQQFAGRDWLITELTNYLPQYAVDFSGDGYPDIMCTPGGYNSELYLAVNTDGTGVDMIPLGINTTSAFHSDIDMDGDLDIIVHTTILYNDGSANFTAVNVGGSVDISDVARIDGDNLPDLFFIEEGTASCCPATYYWRKNLGPSFASQQAITFTGYTQTSHFIHFMDIDADGDDDMFRATNGEVNNTLAISDGTGHFSYESAAEYTFRASRLDVDHDGDLDLLRPDFSLYLNEGDGDLHYLPSEELMAYQELRYYSLAGEGFAGGFAIANDDPYRFPMTDFHINPSTLEPEFRSFYTGAGFYNENMHGLYVDEINNDGLQDVVLISGQTGRQAQRYVSKPNGHLASTPVTAWASTPSTSVAAGYGNFTGDAANEFIVADHYEYFFSSGVYDFETPSLAEVWESGFDHFGQPLPDMEFMGSTADDVSSQVTVVDMNNDGLMDAHVRNGALYINTGSGFVDLNSATTINFLPENSNFDYSTFAVLDVNGDGLLDLWHAAFGSAFIQNPDFTFDEIPCPISNNITGEYDATIWFVTNEPKVTDFNSDGMDDIFFDGAAYINIGGNEFQPIGIGTLSNAYTSCLWDLDGDGDEDILTSPNLYNGNYLNIYLVENLGDGTFGPMQVVFEDCSFISAAATDWEGDGGNDLILTALYGGVAGIYKWEGASSAVELGSIHGTVFADDNANDIMDTGEFSMPLVAVHKDSGLDYSHFTNTQGQYTFNGLEAGDYTIDLVSDLAAITSSPTTVTYTLAAAEQAIVNFPLVPSAIGTTLLTNIYTTLPGCNRTATIMLKIYNGGTTTPDAELTLDLPADVVVEETSITPLSQTSSAITWQLDNIPRYQNTYVYVDVTYPGADHSGLPFSYTFTTDVIDDPLPSDYVATYSGNLVCSFDPNQVTETTGFTDELYVDGIAPLQYMIEFQNTGTAAATNVVVKDELSSLLDWSSLTIEAASHEISDAWISSDGILNFEFEGIELPDSNANEIASHGNIVFSIKPIQGLDAGTAIPNTASIFFDENPAVVTNTVVNHIYSCEDLEQGHVDDTDVCTGQVIHMGNDAVWIEDIEWSFNGDLLDAGSVEYAVVETGELEMHVSNSLCSYVQTWSVVSHELEVVVSVNGNTLTTNTGIAFQWYLNGNEIEGATSSTLQILVSGNYSVFVSDTYGCTNTSEPMQVIFNSAEEIAVDKPVIYPNPAGQLATMLLPAEMIGDAYRVYNSYGQVIMTSRILSTTLNIECNTWPEGVYFIHVGDINLSFVKR